MDEVKQLIGVAVALAKWRHEHPKAPLPVNLDDHGFPELLLALAGIEGAAISERATVSAVHGYLEVRKSEHILFVPYNLSIYFPFAETLEQLIDLAGQVRLSDSGSICISGSATFMGAPVAIADLDFCEYLELPGADIAARVRGIYFASHPYCVSVRCATNALARPWHDEMDPLEQFLGMAAPAGVISTEAWKADYVASFSGGGLLETSNLGVPFGAGTIERDATDKSWTSQEVPIVRADGSPPRLLTASENPIGEYGRWLLHNQIPKFLGPDPVKAAKRALSLASLLRLTKQADDLIDVLGNENLRNLTRRTAAAKLVKRLKKADDPVGTALREKAAASLAALGGDTTSSEFVSVNGMCAKAVDAAVTAANEVLELGSQVLARIRP